MNKIAVALSVYKSDTKKCVVESIESILNQTIPSTLFIKVDGSISSDLMECLIEYNKNENVFVEFNQENKGLAYRLNQIIEQVITLGSFTYLARMDADDICEYNRFEKQVDFLEKNLSIDVVGSDVQEIDEEGNNVFYKKMDSSPEIIRKRIIKKCPFNHPTVMFRMSIFEDGYRYKPESKNTEDYHLWVDLLADGKNFSNINEPLLKFRVNQSFHSRRGLKKAFIDIKSRIYAFKKLDTLSLENIIYVFLLFGLRVSPTFIKKLAYKFLR